MTRQSFNRDLPRYQDGRVKGGRTDRGKGLPAVDCVICERPITTIGARTRRGMAHRACAEAEER